MRLHDFLTVSSVFAILTITASALPKTRFTTTALTSTAFTSAALATTSSIQSITSELLLHRYYGRQASPDTSGSTPTTPAAEYASSEPSKENCDCAEMRSSIFNSPILTSRTITTTAPSLTTLSAIAPAYLYSTPASIIPASKAPSKSSAVRIQPMPQSQYYGMPATTLIQQGQPPAGAAPPVIASPAPAGSTKQAPAGAPEEPANPQAGDAAIPTTITPMPAAPTPTSGGPDKQDIEALISRGGQPWYQVTYYECVTWPSEYVHCGWHTPLRMGRNPNPEGETFVYGAAVRMNGRIGWVVGAVAVVVMLTMSGGGLW